MTTVRTEGATLCIAPEVSRSLQPTTGWMETQWNGSGIIGYEPKLKSVEPAPVSRYMMTEKGTNVGLAVDFKVTHDLTRDWMDMLQAGVFRSLVKHCGGTGQSVFRPTAVTATQYTGLALAAVPVNTAVYASGFSIPGNNGLKIVTASAAGTLSVAGLTAEVPPANAMVEVAGYQGVAGDIKLDANGNLTSTTIDFTTLGLNPFQFMCFPGQSAIQQFIAAGIIANGGQARILTIAAHLITFERRTWTVGAADTAAAQTILIGYTRWIRNVPLSSTDYVTPEPSFQTELELRGAGAAGVSDFTYATGLCPKTLELNAPVQSNIETTVSFVGTDVQNPVLAVQRAAGAATAFVPLHLVRFNTGPGLTRIRLSSQADDSKLIAEVNDWKLTIENNVDPQIFQGLFGPADMTYGDFDVKITMNGYYLTDVIPVALRDNRDCTWDAAVKNGDGGYVFDMPAAAIRGGAKTFAKNKPVMIALDIPAHRETAQGSNIGLSLTTFAYRP